MPDPAPRHAQASRPTQGSASGAGASHVNLPTAKGMTHFERAEVGGHKVDVFFGDENRTDRRGRLYLRMLAVDPDSWAYCYVTAYVSAARAEFKGVGPRGTPQFDGRVSLDARARPIRGTLGLVPAASRREQAAKEAAERAERRGLRKVDPEVEVAAQRARDEEQARADAVERQRLHEAQLAAMVADVQARRARQDQAARNQDLHERQAQAARETAERLAREEQWKREMARRAKAAEARRSGPVATRTTNPPTDPVIVEAESIMRTRFRTTGEVRSARVRIARLMHRDIVGHDRYTNDFGSYNKRLDDIGRGL